MALKVFINNERVGNYKTIGGNEPDFSFFQELAPYLKGSQTITFKVGNQTIENHISLNGLEYRIENNYVPFDIQSYINNEKERLAKIKKAANFKDQLIDVYFIPSKELLSWKSSLPAFDKTFLVKDPKGPTYFVSHSWLSSHHPDPEGKHLKLLQEHAKNLDEDSYYWIDYCCLPQEPRNTNDEFFFMETLPKISSIQANGSTIVVAEKNYSQRMWCYMEHFGGILFSTNYLGSKNREIDYLTDDSLLIHQNMLKQVQTLEEPPWKELQVTNQADILGIKYNYEFLSNIAKFQLYDRFTELRTSLPGYKYYSGHHYPQCAFGIDHSASIQQLQRLFSDFGGDMQYFYKRQSLLWLAERFSWSVYPDNYKINDFQFVPQLFCSKEMIGWIALLLAIIVIANQKNKVIFNYREEYAKIILMSLYK